MIDFNSMMNAQQTPVSVDPVDIYNTLDRTAAAGPLRPVQEEVLNEWFANRFNDRDVILKLHTGEGKTLVGMLMLLSRLNKGCGPCLYVCPNKQLAEQAAADAKKFGIPHVLFKDGELPVEFLDSKIILITHVQKVFNGMSIFGLENKGIPVGTFVLDDSHACIDSIKTAFSIRIQRNSELFGILAKVFETELRKQGEGRYYELLENPFSHAQLTVPYWDWVNKTGDVLQLLMKYQEEKDVKFALPLVRDLLRYCTMYISSRKIEIVPYYPLIEKFTSFSNAEQRILMSATTQDDSFFIKGLGLSTDSVLNPLTSRNKKWSGEKMIIFPSIIDERLNQEVLRKCVSAPGFLGTKACSVLVPGYRLATIEYKERDCYLVSNDEEMNNALSAMRAGTQHPAIVFVNRYDGIDMADDMCRLLVIDSLPVFNSLADQYEVSCRKDSDLINIKIAQKIEQGLGRSVRSERDYSAILIIGAELVRFMKSKRTRKYFSNQTDKQIFIGETVAEMAKKQADPAKPLQPVLDLIGQCLNRDTGWKSFYKGQMDTIEETPQEHPLLSLLERERKADIALRRNDIPAACAVYQDIVDSLKGNDQEQGWYLQELAKYKFFISPTEYKALQKSAFNKNQYVLMPDLTVYKKINILEDSQLKNIQALLKQFSDYNEFRLYTDEVIANLSWGIDSNKFEDALYKIGLLLGFGSQRPDRDIKMGPDNLWALPHNEYIAIECKNEVDLHRDSISKYEAGQMEMHAGWFEQEYSSETPVSYMWVHPTNKLADDAILSHNATVITPAKLELFKKQLGSYFTEYSHYDIHSLADETIHHFLVNSKLMPKDLKTSYSESTRR